MLDAASDLIEVQPLAALPAFDPAKKLKRRKMRINVDSENNVSGQLFIRVIPQKPSSTDADYSDNQVGGEYVVTVP